MHTKLLSMLLVVTLSACNKHDPDKTADCGTLAPLLEVLPDADELGGVSVDLREGKTNNGNVQVTYGTYKTPVRYVFTLQVLSGDSPYVSGFTNNPDDMDASGHDMFKTAVNQIGEGRRIVFENCASKRRAV